MKAKKLTFHWLYHLLLLIMEVIITIIIRSKYFPLCDWLKPHSHIIHHNQLLLTKFEKNYHTEPITSKVQPTADYWILDRENLGTRLCYFWWAEKQRAKCQNSFKNREMFWMNDKAIIEFGFCTPVGYEEFCRSVEFFISYSASFNNC